jgi:two-component system nitrogen regulation sensor histidine kinase GlnL
MMAKSSSQTGRPSQSVLPDPALVLNTIARPILAIDGADRIANVNQAAEHFFEASASSLLGRGLSEILPSDSPVFNLIAQVRADGHSITEYGVAIETPKIGAHLVSVDAAAVAEVPGGVILSLHERSIAGKLDRQLVHRNAARSVTAMAAMLAHELKNPLSGIRGAAQLLEQGATDEDRALTQLICEETDRIVALVDRMEMFSDDRPIAREPVNIHEVLEHVRRVARSGFARNLRLVEIYDPSLPPVFGNRGLLIQALLNLVKNAAEAVGEEDGEIVLSTAYRHGVRLAVSGSGTRVDLPLVIGIQDNGPGIPEDLRPHLFDPFVTTKLGGKGLGLALVAKIVGDHGGVIEFDGQPRRTVFRLMLPIAPEGAKSS